MGTINWQMIIVILIIGLALFGAILTQIQVPNPITHDATSIWNIIWQQVGGFFGGLF